MNEDKLFGDLIFITTELSTLYVMLLFCLF